MKYLITYSLLLLFATTAFSQKTNSLLRQGNKHYDKQNFEEADIAYRKALELDNESFEAYFNLGDALYQQKKYDEAEVKFNMATQYAKSKGDKANAFYNLGNALLEQKKYKESVEAYKNSLRLYPGDTRVQYNLSYALKKLKEQEKQDQQKNEDKENNKDKNEDKEKNKDNKDQDKQDQNKEDKDQNQEQDQQKDNENKEGEQKPDESKDGDKGDENKEQGEKPQPSEQQQGQMSQEQALKLLEALQGEEKKVQAKILKNQNKGKTVKTEKEW